MGATWIHGIDGNPIYKIAQEINAFETDKPWDSMGGKIMEKKLIITEDGHEVNSFFVNPIAIFFNNLLEFSYGEGDFEGGVGKKIVESFDFEKNGGIDNLSIGSYLRKGLEFYWGLRKNQENVESFNLENSGVEKDEEKVESFNLEKNGGIDKLSIGSSYLRKELELYWGLRKDQENVESFNLENSGVEKNQENVESFNLENGGVEKDQEKVESFNLEDGGVEKNQENVESFNFEKGDIEKNQENVESFNFEKGGIEKDQENVESFNLENDGVEKDQENVESFNLENGGVEKDQEKVESFNLEIGGIEKDQENVESFNLENDGIEKDQEKVESFNLENDGIEKNQENVESFNLEKDQENVESFNLEIGGTKKDEENVEVFENWSRKSLEEGVFAMFENIHRHYSSAGDLGTLDFNGESEYCNFPGDEITIAKGYSSVVESLASVLPPGLIQLGRKVEKIEWQLENSDGNKPVKLHFSDGSVMYADHVIVTVSLGVLKQGIREDSSLFSPPLPSFKTEAISRLGFGVVDKLFLQLSPTHHVGNDGTYFPNMMTVFHQPGSNLSNPKIPLWIRRTTLIHPVYPESSVIVSWFAGEEAMKVETLDDEEIIEGFSTTMSQFLANTKHFKNSIKFSKVLKCKWGSDPLFLGSYSHIAVGSSGDDLDAMAEPLPKESSDGKNSKNCPRFQVLFAGEATSRHYYSTTHGAYLTGLREANRLLEHFQCVDV